MGLMWSPAYVCVGHATANLYQLCLVGKKGVYGLENENVHKMDEIL